MKGQLNNYHTTERLGRCLSDLTSLRDYILEAADGGITTNDIPQYRAKPGTAKDIDKAVLALRRALTREDRRG